MYCFPLCEQDLPLLSGSINLQKMLVESSSCVFLEMALVRSACSFWRANMLLNTIGLLNIRMEARALDMLKNDVFLVGARN